MEHKMLLKLVKLVQRFEIFKAVGPQVMSWRDGMKKKSKKVPCVPENSMKWESSNAMFILID